MQNERSDSTLASRVARDGKLFERVRSGASVTTVTLERFFAFFRDAQNWKNAVVPARVSELLDGVDLSAVHIDPDTIAPQHVSPGNDAPFSPSVQHG